ncbi:MAG: tetratricopeptide repeat protein [Planctomycetaceae bacterium]|jgi:tetratricopeptide (TPR) repeat protein|nr:tetratricopeptide repeat protein [Planctomycetaceae bacterium]
MKRDNSNDAEKFWQNGLACFEKNDYLNAILLFTKALHGKCGAPFEQVYLYRAYAWFKRGEYEIAIMDINAAIRETPDNADLYKARGQMRSELTQYGKAIRDFTIALELAPKDATILHERSVAYEKESNWKNALQDIETAINFAGKDAKNTSPELFIQRAKIYKNTKCYEKALNDCNLIQATEEPPAEIYLICGDIHLEQGNFIKAHDMYAQATKIDPNLTEVDISLAKSYFLKDEYDKAIFYCNKYIEKIPESVECYLICANSYYFKNELDEALNNCNRAVEYNPYCAEAYKIRAKIFRAKRDFLSAERDEKRTNELENKTKKLS